MSGALAEAVARLGAIGRGYAGPATTKAAIQWARERIDKRFDARNHRKESESDAACIARVSREWGRVVPTARDLKRVLRLAWDVETAPPIEELLDAAVARDRRSIDRAMAIGYLSRFPCEVAGFARFAAACTLVTARRDWPWRLRATRWRLFEADGPDLVGGGLLELGNEVLADAGLDGALAQGGFVSAALKSACDRAAVAAAAEAEALGAALIALAAKGVAVPAYSVARALLRPWSQRPPSSEHQKSIMGFLARKIGDPRLDRARWAALNSALRAAYPGEDTTAYEALLKRWLVASTVWQFFDIVDRTTGNTAQWTARRKFWTAYVEAGAITEAWFAFGGLAEAAARRIYPDMRHGSEYGRVQGYAAPGHSALVIQLGDLRIAEWSHNGKARFWDRQANARPELYRREYDGHALRREANEPGFDAISHQGSWEYRFASHIRSATGVRHPVFG